MDLYKEMLKIMKEENEEEKRLLHLKSTYNRMKRGIYKGVTSYYNAGFDIMEAYIICLNDINLLNKKEIDDRTLTLFSHYLNLAIEDIYKE